jgi:hypothetical protein
MTPTFSILFYVNGELTHTTKNLQINDVYTNAIPLEALRVDENSRWHVMLRHAALATLQTLLAGETLRVCWQQPSIYNWADTEHVLIMKDPYDRNMIDNTFRNINKN